MKLTSYTTEKVVHLQSNNNDGMDIKDGEETLFSINPENKYSSNIIIVLPAESKIKVYRAVPMVPVTKEKEQIIPEKI